MSNKIVDGSASTYGTCAISFVRYIHEVCKHRLLRFFDGIQYLPLPNESVLSRINQEEQMFAERRKRQLLQLRLRLVEETRRHSVSYTIITAVESLIIQWLNICQPEVWSVTMIVWYGNARSIARRFNRARFILHFARRTV